MAFDKWTLLYSALYLLVSSIGEIDAEATTIKPTTKFSIAKPTTKISDTKPTTKISITKPTRRILTAKPTTILLNTKPTTKILMAKTTTKIPAPKPTITIATSEPATKISTTTKTTRKTWKTSTTTMSVAIGLNETNECICEQSDDVPFIAVTTILTICILGYILLAAFYMFQRYRQRPSTNDAETMEETKDTNDYSTTPTASVILYENVQVQNDQSGNSVHGPMYADDANPYQNLGPVNDPQHIYENLTKQK